MPYTQKEEGLGAYNSSVQTSDDGDFTLVPESPVLLPVEMDFLQFHTPNTRFDNPRDDILYLVALVDGALTIVEVPMEGAEQGEDPEAPGP